MNKMEYQKPWAELIQFENEDIVTASKEPSCTAETGCTGGCDNKGWDGLGVCVCGVHEGYSMGVGCVVPIIGLAATERYMCHDSLAQGMANAGVSSSSSGKRTLSEDYSMGLDEDYGADTENWDN